MKRRSRASLLAFALLCAVSTAEGRAEIIIEGNFDSLSITARQVQRTAVIDALIDRFELDVEGRSVADGAIDGHFSGTLSQVLRSVLQTEGYIIAYRNGRPARITFARHGNASASHSLDRTVRDLSGSDEIPPAVVEAERVPMEAEAAEPPAGPLVGPVVTAPPTQGMTDALSFEAAIVEAEPVSGPEPMPVPEIETSRPAPSPDDPDNATPPVSGPVDPQPEPEPGEGPVPEIETSRPAPSPDDPDNASPPVSAPVDPQPVPETEPGPDVQPFGWFPVPSEQHGELIPEMAD